MKNNKLYLSLGHSFSFSVRRAINICCRNPVIVVKQKNITPFLYIFQ